MTALSLAASNNNAKAVQSLLNNGADLAILTCEGLSCMDIALNNRFHDVCMVIAKSDKWKEALVSTTTMESCLKVSPEVAKVILDKCIEYSGREIDKDYKVTYHFELLDPPPDKNETYYGPLAMKIARRHDLLGHPLTKKLLHTNWINGVRYIYYSQMFLLAAALVSLTLFLWWAARLMNDCHKKVLAEYKMSTGVDKIPNNSTFYADNENYCYEKLGYGVSKS
ncbi:transient receptor potential cation channel subfamily A member 1-like [Paramuricea clavata]|uniref:Transient receptor potential cation channel subfamily A member 1-like n=1 Tax=Paramuricea clavata TaxID=317549 RepID=A0A7D9M2X9_PARCT|nr:transient receptor potential cation channel subfamily A member 1-like [Paramuricea clavata]